jgi:hypothetical protein
MKYIIPSTTQQKTMKYIIPSTTQQKTMKYIVPSTLDFITSRTSDAERAGPCFITNNFLFYMKTLPFNTT